MPEGPEIRRAADALAAAVAGRTLQRVWFEAAELKPWQRRLEGGRIESVEPRGKALLTWFADGPVMYSHNQLYGVWHIADAGRRPDTSRKLRVALETAERAILLYSASDVSIWPRTQIEQHPFLHRIGPDVLDPALDQTAVRQRLDGSRFARRQLGTLLLDQAFLAGLGNYLRAEILWQAGVSPSRRAADLDDAQRSALAAALLDVPRRSYRARGRATAGLQDTPFRFRVYERAGHPCPRCGTIIERRQVASRPFFACPRCQT